MMERYIRVKLIGEGSFGKALLVKKKSDGRHYVIKEINISKMSSKEREASRKEVKVLAQLKHPNIVSYQESFEEKGNLYIVMDYCEGGDLYKRINGQRGVMFTEEQAMDWFVQICLALKHVHDRKILHRDLKSQNIFLTKSGMIKLGDFGIARVLHSTVELARTCIGTPYYLSPEICENRPYNNKSDVWSLGCVLYELLTLKHAFEAGNMKNLVLKIIRGAYPPIPLKYSADVRVLLAELLKRSPRSRPSVNTILRKPFIQRRIEKFLSEDVIEAEFSHTIIHRKPLGLAGQRGIAAKPAKAVRPAPKITDPKAKYGVSVAKKKPVKKPSSNNGVKKPSRPPGGEAARYGDKRVVMGARERRREEMAQQQNQAYEDYMKKVQQQRWERQQYELRKKDRDNMGWKATLKVGLSPEKENKPAAAAKLAKQQDVMFKEPQPMQKYQGKNDDKQSKENKAARPVSAQVQKAVKPAAQPARPVSASNANAAVPSKPRPAWEAAHQGEINRAMGGAAADQARVLEEFWLRKKEAAVNKERGRQDYGHYDHWPPAAQHQEKLAGNGGKGEKVEKDYLDRLEAIRHQNFQERKDIQRRVAGIRDPVEPPPAQEQKFLAGDPRYDPEARRKKIAALKSQAAEREAMLKQQLKERKKLILQKVNQEKKERAEQEIRREELKKRPLPSRAVVEEPPEEKQRAVAPIGIETALKDIGVTKFFRSSSENDISKLGEEQVCAPRKQWGDIPFQPRMLPLEITSSAMEATGAEDVVYKPGVGINPVRKQWGQPQKTQIVSALGQAKLQSATTTITGQDEPDAVHKDKTVVIKPPATATQPGSPAMGATVTVTKSTVTKPLKDEDKAGTTALPSQPTSLSPALPAPSEGALLEVEETWDGAVEDIPTITAASSSGSRVGAAPSSPIKAWGADAKQSTPTKESDVPRSPTRSGEQKPMTAERSSYDAFLKSTREKKEEEPLFEKVSLPQEEYEGKEDDMEVEDVSLDDLSFHTADGSPKKTTRGILLSSGSYDTDSERLRTCSLPDLRLLFRSTSPDCQQQQVVMAQDEEDEDEDQDGDDEDEDEDEDEELPVGSDDDDDEGDEYENMLASMRDVLVSSARSPSPMKSAPCTVGSLDWDHSVDTSATPVDDENDVASAQPDRPDSELSNLNEDWQSDDDEDEEDGNANAERKNKHDKKDLDDDETVFQRLEESRQMLEQELGIKKFLRVYKFLQAVQDNEDDNADVGSAAEISDLLGDKEHLYPKILYLIIADSAYIEDNQ